MKQKFERNNNQTVNNLIIRPEESRDYLPITEVNNLAFGRNNEAILIEKIRNSNKYIPKLSLVAELDNKTIGYIMFSHIDLIGEKVTKVLSLAPIAILPQYQNRGMGSLLVEAGLKIAENTASPMVIVLGDCKFYSRFGFKPAIDYGIQSDFNVPDEAFMVRLLTKNNKNYSGKIKYPSAFNNV